MTCTAFQSALADLLLDPQSAKGLAAQEHLSACSNCAAEFHSLESTLDLLDIWEAPDPSPYFDQKLSVRLRELQAAPPESWLDRVQSYLLLNTGRHFRPALASALALVLLIGGGTAVDISGAFHAKPVQASATVQDLQILDRNDQAMQTMDQLLQEEPASEDASGTPSS